jgi:acyl-CoA dehydrogenase
VKIVMREIALEIVFDETHATLRSEVRSFVERRIAPLAELEERDLIGSYRRMQSLLGASGILGEVVPMEFGGKRHNLDVRSICIAREELAAVSGTADLLFVMQGLGSYPLQIAGDERLKRRWLPKVAKGKALAALALTEEDAGSDVASIATTARKDGKDYVLDGEKWFISNAGVADFYTVFASVDRNKGKAGITAFLVEADRPGFQFVRPMETLAPHPLGVVRFAECRIPAINRLGEEGAGLGIAMATLDTFRTSVGAAAVGMAGRALRETLAFVPSRRQFGRPLSEFQMTQAALADMAVDYEAARMLVYRAACARDLGTDRVTLEASIAKLFATEAAQRVVDRALQLHGGRGLLHGSVTERLYRDVRALRIYEGTSEIQKLVIASQLLGKRG